MLQAAGGVTGAYTTTKGSAFIDFAASYDATHVYLDVTQINGFASVGITPNQIATGGAVELLGSGNAIHDAVLTSATDADAQYAFDQLSGEVHASAKSVMLDDSRFAREAADDQLRARMGGGNATGTTPDDTGNGLAYWNRGFGNRSTIDSDGNAATTSSNAGGMFIGGDAALAGNFHLGMLAGYSHSITGVSDRRSSAAVDSYQLGFYGGNTWGNLGFRAGAIHTWHAISTCRTVEIPGFSDRLTADYSARTEQVFGEFGYGIDLGQTAIGATRLEPFANLAYVNLTSGRFTESGGAAALSGAGGSSNVAFTAVGLRGSSDIVLNGGTELKLHGMLGWRHGFGDMTPEQTLPSRAAALSPSPACRSPATRWRSRPVWTSTSPRRRPLASSIPDRSAPALPTTPSRAP